MSTDEQQISDAIAAVAVIGAVLIAMVLMVLS